MTAARIRKRCRKCGQVARVTVRTRTCWRRQFGRGSYACGGALERVDRFDRPAPKPKPSGLEVLNTRRNHAAAKLNEAIKRATRAAGIVSRWRRRVDYYNREIIGWLERGGARPPKPPTPPKPTRLYGADDK